MFDYISWFQNFPHWLATLLIAMIPIGEIRAAVPVAIGIYEMSWWDAYIWSVIGNIIPVVFILWLLNPLSKFLMKHSKIFNKFFTWIFDRTRRKYTKKFERLGELALIAFVAIPLPMTGAWTGAVAAFIFGISFKKALPLIFLGILIAGVIVILVSMGVIHTSSILMKC